MWNRRGKQSVPVEEQINNIKDPVKREEMRLILQGANLQRYAMSRPKPVEINWRYYSESLRCCSGGGCNGTGKKR